ncbi:transposase [Streptomyces salinarius]|uniref:Transposase n=1 Tax=Streptomyces salinarius TaxID=2762598 RepID=A0ABW8BBD5_9ACTN
MGAGGDRLFAGAGRPTGLTSGPSPVAPAQPGSKRHRVVDGQRVPLAVSLIGGHRNDVTQLLSFLEPISPVADRVGRPRGGPDALSADRGYDHDIYRRLFRQRGMRPVIAKRASHTVLAWT